MTAEADRPHRTHRKTTTGPIVTHRRTAGRRGNSLHYFGQRVLKSAFVPVVELAFPAVADLAGEGVAVLLEVADVLDVAAVGLVDVDELEDVQGLEDPAVGGDRLAQCRRTATS